MGRYGPPPRGRIVNPRMLNTPVEITPQSQLAPYYGGKRGIVDAIIDADLQANRVTEALNDIDPNSDIRNLFPQPLYGRYGDEVTVMPIRPDDAEFTGRAVGHGEFGMPVPIGENPTQMLPAPDQTPAIMLNRQPMQLDDPMHFGSKEATDVLRGEVLEKPLTDYVTGFADNPTAQRMQPLMDSDALGAAIAEAGLRGADDDFGDGAMMANMIAQRTSPQAIDQTLAQIRRRTGGGESAMPYEQARGLIDSAVESAMQIGRNNPLSQGGYQNMLTDPTTGLPIQDLIALGLLPPEYRRFAPTRMGELLGIGGAMAGMGMGSQGNQQGIDPRSTMGPLSGLMQ